MQTFFIYFCMLIYCLIIACTFFASFRFAFGESRKRSAKPVIAFFSHEKWLYSLVLILPIYVGQFARGEISINPWAAFLYGFRKHNFVEGAYYLIIVIIIELWMLWIPGRLYLQNCDNLDKRTKILVRCLNLAVGLLLLTPHNPIYNFIDHFPKESTYD
jgi:hypothetical protein